MKTVIEAEKNYFFRSPLIALKAKQIQIKWTNKHIKLIAFPAAGTETSNNTNIICIRSEHIHAEKERKLKVARLDFLGRIPPKFQS